ncbi:MAG: nitrate/nitrite transporter NrtS [Oscillatoriales cyanobacterium SM2_2_1]|nr:nitrate/nitrite transporter NrtS [Oscillatoriales cyanobacterium SM2_2_1]
MAFLVALFDWRYGRSAVVVAIVVGTLLFVINHGFALIQGEMTPVRWTSALLTYVVPYIVNIHGQYTSQRRASHEYPPNPEPDKTV